MMSLSEYPSFLHYESADIYFIYSFALDFHRTYQEIVERLERLGWTQGIPPDRKGRPPFLYVKRKSSASYLSTSTYLNVLPKSHARLGYREKWPTKLKNADSEVEYSQVSQSCKVQVEAWARIFDNGAGSITFRIRVKESVDFRRVYEVLSLSQRTFNPDYGLARLRIDSSIAFGLRDDEELELYHIFRWLLASAVEKINEGEERERVTLQDHYVMDLDGPTVNGEPPAQNPYVLSVLELKNLPNEAPPPAEPSQKTLMEKELAGILYRTVYPLYTENQDNIRNNIKEIITHIRQPEFYASDGPFLRNFAWDLRIIMSFSETSSLFVFPSGEEDKVPTVLVRNSLLNVLEILRSRWHMSIVINALLDEDLESFKEPAPSKDNLKVLLRLIQRRKQFASFMHDPLPYSFEGGSVSTLANAATREMKLPELRRMTIEKLDTLDRLHADSIKYITLSEF